MLHKPLLWFPVWDFFLQCFELVNKQFKCSLLLHANTTEVLMFSCTQREWTKSWIHGWHHHEQFASFLSRRFCWVCRQKNLAAPVETSRPEKQMSDKKWCFITIYAWSKMSEIYLEEALPKLFISHKILSWSKTLVYISILTQCWPSFWNSMFWTDQMPVTNDHSLRTTEKVEQGKIWMKILQERVHRAKQH